MVNRDLLAAKLSELADRRERVRTHVPQTPDELLQDRDALDIVAFNRMLCVQICSDIASHLIADEGWASSQTLAQGFTRLHEHGVIMLRTSESLKRAVGLRNIVAHGYVGIDVEACHRAATTGLLDLEAFAQEVSAWAQRMSEDSLA
jgi:uncharacterized protein YutE (UPF0331/DUF86 family)